MISVAKPTICDQFLLDRSRKSHLANQLFRRGSYLEASCFSARHVTTSITRAINIISFETNEAAHTFYLNETKKSQFNCTQQKEPNEKNAIGETEAKRYG